MSFSLVLTGQMATFASGQILLEIYVKRLKLFQSDVFPSFINLSEMV